MVKAEKAFKWGIAIIVIFGTLNAFYFLNLVIALKIVLPILCIFLIGAILLQSGKGGGLAAIGGLGDQAAFGTRTSTFLTKVTYLIGAAFIIATIFLFKLSITNVMSTKVAREIPMAGHKHTHEHPAQEGDNKHANVPHTKREVDKTSNVGMQNVKEGANESVHEQSATEGGTSESQSVDTDITAGEKQTSGVTEKPMVGEQTKTGENSSN